MKKKVLAGILIVTMAFGLVACGGGKGSMKKGEPIKVEGVKDYNMLEQQNNRSGMWGYYFSFASLDENGIFDLNQFLSVSSGVNYEGKTCVSAEFYKGSSESTNLTYEDWALLLNAITINAKVNGKSIESQRNMANNPEGSAYVRIECIGLDVSAGDVVTIEIDVNKDMLDGVPYLLNAKGYTWHDVEYTIPELEQPIVQPEVAAPEAALEEAAPEAGL